MKTKNLLLISALCVGIAGGFTSCSKDDKKTPDPVNPTPTPTPSNVVTVTDNGSGTGTTTWTNDKVYLLDGFVFVNSGQELTIQQVQMLLL